MQFLPEEQKEKKNETIIVNSNKIEFLNSRQIQ